MTTLLLNQYLFELQTQSRQLCYLQEENNFYKNRIADIVSTNCDSALLEILELFLAKFIAADPVLALLKHDVVRLNESCMELTNESACSKNIIAVIKVQAKLGMEIEIAGQQFTCLKSEFNRCVSAHFWGLISADATERSK